jgi:hypothetical protein
MREVMTEAAALLGETVDNHSEEAGLAMSMSLQHLWSNGTGCISSSNAKACLVKSLVMILFMSLMWHQLQSWWLQKQEAQSLFNAPQKVTIEALVELSVESMQWQGGSLEYKSVNMFIQMGFQSLFANGASLHSHLQVLANWTTIKRAHVRWSSVPLSKHTGTMLQFKMQFKQTHQICWYLTISSTKHLIKKRSFLDLA